MTLTTYESLALMMAFGLFIVTFFSVIIAMLNIFVQNKK